MAYVWLNTTVEACVRDSDLMLWSGNDSLRVQSLGRVGLEFLAYLDGGLDSDEVQRLPAASVLLPLLEERGWLVTLSKPLPEIVAGRPWISRQLAYLAQICTTEPDRALVELARKWVLVVGVGGVGSHVAFVLGGMGVGRMTLIDPDVVEPSNLNRQILFTQEHIGLPKVDVAVESLVKRFPNVRVEPIRSHLAARHLAQRSETDLILISGGTDLPFERPELIADRPILLAGYSGPVGVVGPLVCPSRGGCWRCLVEAAEPPGLPCRVGHGVPRKNAWNTSGSTINALIGALAGEVIVRHLASSLGSCPLAGDERVKFDMRSFAMTRETLLKGPCRHSSPSFVRSTGAEQ